MLLQHAVQLKWQRSAQCSSWYLHLLLKTVLTRHSSNRRSNMQQPAQTSGNMCSSRMGNQPMSRLAGLMMMKLLLMALMALMSMRWLTRLKQSLLQCPALAQLVLLLAPTPVQGST
jgi:hypothetical protein